MWPRREGGDAVQYCDLNAAVDQFESIVEVASGPRRGHAGSAATLLVTTSLEIIDPNGAVDQQVEALDRVCRTLGFFRVPFAVLADDVREAAWEDAARFFALSDEAKMAVAFPEPGYPYGFSPFAFETLAASTGATSNPDLKESLSVGPDCLGQMHAVSDPAEAWLRSPSQWPAEPASIRESWSAYFRACSEVSAKLLSLMAQVLDLPADHFDALIDRHTSAMRAVNYPALDAKPSPGSLRAGAHSDYGTLTILRTDGVPGLEMQQADGIWAPIVDEPGTFVVNLGDSVAQWTNDHWHSTVHRVTTVDRGPRQSMAFFHMANWDARIECPPTCLVAGERPKHEPVLAGPWLMSKFHKTVR